MIGTMPLAVSISLAIFCGLIVSTFPIVLHEDHKIHYRPQEIVIYPEFKKIKMQSNVIVIDYTLPNSKRLELIFEKNGSDNLQSMLMIIKTDESLASVDKKEIQKVVQTLMNTIIDNKIKAHTFEKETLVKKQQALQSAVNNHLTEATALSALNTQMAPLNKKIADLNTQIEDLQTARASQQAAIKYKETNEDIRAHALMVSTCYKTIESCKEKIVNLEKSQKQYPALVESFSQAKHNLEKTIAQAEATLKEEAEFSRIYGK